MSTRASRSITFSVLLVTLLASATVPAVGAVAARSSTAGGATVDTQVEDAVARGRSVDALVILDGSDVLRSARPGRGSAALLRATVPGYRALKATVLARHALTVVSDFRTLPIVEVRVRSAAQLDALASDPAVVGVAADHRLERLLLESLPLIGQPDVAAQGHTGEGVGVAVLDSGVDYLRSAFGACLGGVGSPGCRVVVAEDTAPDDGLLDDAVQHGTNVAGIVAGVAPDARILAYDVFDGGGASVSDILEAIDATISLQSTYNVRAMNLSLGDSSHHTSPCGSAANPFLAAFANARAAGIVPVVASGNAAFEDGASRTGIAVPACTPGALPVGAVYDGDNGGLSWGSPPDRCTDGTTAADQVTCFSQSWRADLVLAPGALTMSAGVLQGGTSQAAPHVSGAIAVLHDAYGVGNGATTDMVSTALLTSGPSIFHGLVNRSFRRLDLPSAVATLSTMTPAPPPPETCTVEGDVGDNTLAGTPDADRLCGGDGDDVLVAGAGNDVFDGGSGFDVLDLRALAGGSIVNLALGTGTAGGVTFQVVGVEAVLGTASGDTLLGSSAGNDLAGLGGDDVVAGRGGDDALLGGRGNDRLSGGGGDDALIGGRGDDTCRQGRGTGRQRSC